jgi:hypothetical protein
MMTDDMFAGTSMQPAYVPPGYPPLLFSSFYYHSGFHPMSPQQPVSPIAFYPAQPAFDMTYSQASPMPATAVYSTSPHGAYHQPMFHPMVAPLSAPHMHPQLPASSVPIREWFELQRRVYRHTAGLERPQRMCAPPLRAA